jgi:hypothetical protein
MCGCGIAIGYLQVNTGNFVKAIGIFNELLQVYASIVALCLQRCVTLCS